MLLREAEVVPQWFSVEPLMGCQVCREYFLASPELLGQAANIMHGAGLFIMLDYIRQELKFIHAAHLAEERR